MSFSITILGIGRATDGFSGVYDHFIGMIRPFAPVSLELLKPSISKSLDPVTLMRKEGELFMGRWPEHGYPVVLTPEGKSLNTSQFSQWIGLRRAEGRPLFFTLGGAYGLSEPVKTKARERLSVSGLTLAHRVCIVVLLEQIYRSFTILNGHPYNK